MQYIKHFTLILISIFIISTLAFAGDKTNWQLDKAHSSVNFTVRHLGISKVNGNFKDFDAIIYADKNTGKLTSFEGTVKVSSVNTGISKRDDHLKADDFFSANKFPDMKMKSVSIIFNGNNFSGVVDFTMKGVTKRQTYSGEFLGTRIADFGSGKTKRAGYSLTLKVNRQDYGLSFNRLAEGVSIVGDEVTINIEIEMFRKVE